MLMRQVKLRNGNLHIICWVENDSRLKKGIIIKLKDLQREWTIEEVFDQIVEKNKLNKDWKVGGLF